MKYHYTDSVNLKETGKKLKRAIEESDYTENELAEYLGISIRSIQYWKSGKKLPSLDNLLYLCHVIDKNVNDLVCFENEARNRNLNEILSEMAQSDPSPFVHYYRKKFKIRTIEDFIAFLPLYDEEALNDVIYRISGESIDQGTYMLEQLDYLFNQIKDEKARDEICKKRNEGGIIWNTHKILAIVDVEIYKMAQVLAFRNRKSIKNYIIELIKDDFEKNELKFNKDAKFSIEFIKSMNDEDDCDEK